MNIQSQVLHILEQDKESRNDDNRLVCVLWNTFHPEKVKDGMVALKDIIQELPKAETIGRARRMIQNDLGLYVPTSQAVAKGRKMAQDEWEEAMRHDFTPSQAKAILQIFMEAKGKSSKELKLLVDQIRTQL